jgi:hypothetical protein
VIPFYALLAGQNPFQRGQVSEKTLFFKSTLPNRISPAKADSRNAADQNMHWCILPRSFLFGNRLCLPLMVLFCPPK